MRLRRRLELFCPFIIAILVAGIGFALMHVHKWEFDANRPQFLQATVTFGAIMAGFIATNFSIIVMNKSNLMTRMKRANYYNSLIDYLRIALYLSIALASLGLLALFFVDWIPPTGRCTHVLGAIWLWLTCWTVIHFIHVVRISVAIFKQPD